MSSVLSFPFHPGVVDAALESDDSVRQQIWRLLGGLYPRGNTTERRADQRFPYPYLIHLTPVGDDGVSPAGDSVIVIGKHLSERGLGFYHQQPLLDRRMIASLEVQKSEWAGFLIDITWCRFTQHGWYDSGGRFLQAVNSPVVGQARLAISPPPAPDVLQPPALAHDWPAASASGSCT